MNNTIVKIFGSPRTGTNLVRYILEKLGCRVLVDVDQWGDRCWKHGAPRPSAPHHVIVVGPPAGKWVIQQRAFHGPDTAHWGESEYLAHQKALWDFDKSEGCIVVSLTDLLSDWGRTVRRIAHSLSLPLELADFEMPEGRLNAADDNVPLEVVDPREKIDVNWHREGWVNDKGDIDLDLGYYGYGDALCALACCENLRQMGHNPVLWVNHWLMDFCRKFYPHHKIANRERIHLAGTEPIELTSTKLYDENPELSHHSAQWLAIAKRLDYAYDPFDRHTPAAMPSLRHDKIRGGYWQNHPLEMWDGIQVYNLIFPFASRRIRQYPFENWVRFAIDQWEHHGRATLFCGPDSRSGDLVRINQIIRALAPIFGIVTTWDDVIALMLHDNLVRIYANDSGPAHLGGVLGKRVTVMSAAFPAIVYAPYPSVDVIMGKAACVGCCNVSSESLRYRPELCSPDYSLAQPDPSTNVNGSVMGPGCAALKTIWPTDAHEPKKHKGLESDLDKHTLDLITWG